MERHKRSMKYRNTIKKRLIINHITFQYIFLATGLILLGSCSELDFDVVEIEKFDYTDIDTFSITHPDFEQSYLTALNTDYQLSEKVSGCSFDIQKAQIICHWVHKLWVHHTSNIPENNDPASIISEAMAGGRFKCTEYSIVLSGCLSAIGLPSRTITLCSSDINNRHVTSEVYLWDIEKWVMIDGQWDAIPMKNNNPLSCFELLETMQDDVKAVNISSLSSVDKWYFLDWMAPYLYQFAYLDNIESYWNKEAKDDIIILQPHRAEWDIDIFESPYFSRNPNAVYKQPVLLK